MKLAKLKKKERAIALRYIIPSFSGFALITLLPLTASFLLVFTNWDGSYFQNIRFIGFKNIFYILTRDWLFWQSMFHNLVYSFGVVPTQIVLGILIAVLMNETAFFQRTLRAIYFIPYITLTTAVVIVWMTFFQPTWGPINTFLKAIGIQTPPGWLTERSTSLISIMIVSVWQYTGYYMVIFLAGLQSIPAELYEAAEIDGAGKVKQFFKITLPLLTPIILFAAITGIIFSFRTFLYINVMTQGGPGTSSYVMVFYLYQTAFKDFRFGYASALAWMLFLVIFSITLIQWRLQKKWVFQF
ncbi:MAG: sugar ABC transporter permease [Spirochaetota bacterium]